MIIITPFIAPLAARIGPRKAVGLGFLLAAAGFVALTFVKASWAYAAFVVPLVATAVGLGIANGPASSASTSSVSEEQVGAASGISNMARYVGAPVAVAAAAMIDNTVLNDHLSHGASRSDALASGLAAASLMMAIWCAAGIGLIVLMARGARGRPSTVERAAAAASAHTIPTRPCGCGADRDAVAVAVAGYAFRGSS
jgi:MFS family permease